MLNILKNQMFSKPKNGKMHCCLLVCACCTAVGKQETVQISFSNRVAQTNLRIDGWNFFVNSRCPSVV
jgi:hypothetical protein